MSRFAMNSLIKWTIKLNVIIWIANVIIFVILTLIDRNATVLQTFFTKASFLETGITLLVGGILTFSSSVLPSKAREYISKSEEHWSIDTLKIAEKKANKYLLLAVILFIQSIIISFLGY
ncbi:MAG TPA: hypothetical protein VLU95_02670 [Candidatus Acidoferrum sp.]|nr:hypothetical protein [Candidatus Acidoferrum sp.]